MTASLNGKRTDVPLRELDLGEVPGLEDAQASIERSVFQKLATLEVEVDRLHAQLAAKRRPLIRGNVGELFRWAAFLWLVAYGVIALVEMVVR